MKIKQKSQISGIAEETFINTRKDIQTSYNQLKAIKGIVKSFSYLSMTFSYNWEI